MSPSRRALLAALGTALAGCSADPGQSPTTTDSETQSPPDPATDTDTASPTPEPSAPERVELDDDRVRWRVDVPADGVVGLTAAEADDTLYVGTTNQSTLTPEPGEPEATGGFAALSVPDGQIRHYRELEAPVTDGPAVHDGDPYVTVGYSTGYDGREQRLQRLSPEGEVRWESPTRDAWLSLYDFDAGSAYLGTGDDGLAPSGETTFAVNLESGAERWETDGGDAGAGRVDGETLYAGYAGMALAALETSDGTERWRRAAEPLHSREQSFPEAGGRLFARVEDGADSFAALDPADGSTVWEQSGVYATSVTPINGVVVGTGYDGTVFARDAETGETRWSRQFTGRPDAPLVADGRLFVAFSEGPLVALDIGSGETAWRTERWSGAFVRYLSVADGTLFSVVSHGDVSAVAAWSVDDGSRRWRRGVPGRTQAIARADGVLALAITNSVYGVALD